MLYSETRGHKTLPTGRNQNAPAPPDASLDYRLDGQIKYSCRKQPLKKSSMLTRGRGRQLTGEKILPVKSTPLDDLFDKCTCCFKLVRGRFRTVEMDQAS